MPAIGLELCDAGLHVAAAAGDSPQLLPLAGEGGALGWPAFVYQDGKKFQFGPEAEDMWLVHPRHVSNTFLAKFTHEPSPLALGGKPQSFSELAFFFLRDAFQRLEAAHGTPEKVVLAVPGGYLKDPAVEEEKVGLLLGIAGELKLPLAGIVDLACAALCDPRAGGFTPNLPAAVLDVHLHGADLTLFTSGARLERVRYLHLPQVGYAHLLKHLNGTMGNRFLRHTAFDILADGRIEQMFYRQTKDFVVAAAPESRFQVNTASRAYEMIVKQEQFAADAQAFAGTLVQALTKFLGGSGAGAEPCTVALTERAAGVPGLEGRLRAAGFNRILRLPRGAAACGAAVIGERRLALPAALEDVPVETGVPAADACRAAGAPWDAHLHKGPQAGPRALPTHAVIDGIGHALDRRGGFTVGTAGTGADLALPEPFNAAGDCVVSFVREDGRLWLVGPDGAGRHNGRAGVEAGDVLRFRCGPQASEVLFVHCLPAEGPR